MVGQNLGPPSFDVVTLSDAALALIVWRAFGSQTTMSASLPGAITPLRGYSPNSRAGVVETSSTKRFKLSRAWLTPW